MDTIVRKEDIQQAEADMLLERAIDISVVVTKTPKWWELWKKEKQIKYTFSVRPLTIGQQQRIVGRLAKLDESPFHTNQPTMKVYGKMVAENMDDIIYCVGVMLTPPKEEPKVELLQFIKDHFDNETMEKMWHIMVKQMYVNPFLSGIVLIKGIEMNPTT